MVGEVKLYGGDGDIAGGKSVDIGIFSGVGDRSASADPVVFAAPGVQGFMDGVFPESSALAGNSDFLVDGCRWEC